MQRLFNQRQLALLLVVGAPLLAAAWLWRMCVHDNRTSFLPRCGKAEWIAYPVEPDGTVRPVKEISALYRRSFTLQTLPAKALLDVRFFRRGSVEINGVPVLLSQSTNWKQPQTCGVTALLHQGENRISATVSNDTAVPALWLQITAGTNLVRTDEHWEVTWADAAWQPARPASAPMMLPPGNPFAGGENPWDSLCRNWLRLMVFFLLSAIAVALAKRWVFQGLGLLAPGISASAFVQIAVPVAVVALLWLFLFWNNVRVLPRLVGFDVDAHLDYIRYIMQEHRLPLAHEGFAMYHPPLYYLLSATVLFILGPLPLDETGVLALRLCGAGVGVAHAALVLASLRLLFPRQIPKQLAGLVVAVFLPAHLYLAHYVTNESLAAMLVTASIYLCLRVLQQEQPSFWLYGGLGLCLGAALLTKATALLAVPLILGAVCFRLFKPGMPRLVDNRDEGKTVGLGVGAAEAAAPVPVTSPQTTTQVTGLEKATWSGREAMQKLALLLVAFGLVAGWHYLRVWHRYGTPLVTNWDPPEGYHWWEDEGFRTSAFYFRFGLSFVQPFSSGLNSFADGLYTTWWGDGWCSSAVNLDYRPPWHYDLMAAGYLLALVPTVLILVGVISSAARFIRAPTPQWGLLLGQIFLMGWAMVALSLKIPGSASVKGFYGLSALLPVCAFCAEAWEVCTRRRIGLRWIVSVLMAMWALTSYATFWISGHDPRTHVFAGLMMYEDRRYDGALLEFEEALRLDPGTHGVRDFMAITLAQVGRLTEARQQAELAVKEHPNSADALTQLGLLQAQQKEEKESVATLQRALELAPHHPRALQALPQVLLRLGDRAAAARACRAALRVMPTNAGLHDLLAKALQSEPESRNPNPRNPKETPIPKAGSNLRPPTE